MARPQLTEQIVTDCTVTVDEDFIRSAVTKELRAQGFRVHEAATVEWDISPGFSLDGATVAWREYSSSDPDYRPGIWSERAAGTWHPGDEA